MLLLCYSPKVIFMTKPRLNYFDLFINNSSSKSFVSGFDRRYPPQQCLPSGHVTHSHAPGGDGVPGHAGPVRVLGDHGGEDLLDVVAVGCGHQVRHQLVAGLCLQAQLHLHVV